MKHLLLFLFPLVLGAQTLLTSVVNPYYTANTYKWHLANTQQSVTLWSNGIVVKEYIGNGSANIKQAHTIQPHAENVYVALLDFPGTHANITRQVVQEVAPQVNIIEIPLNGGADVWYIPITNAIKQGADIINIPSGSPAGHTNLYSVIKTNPQVLFVCAAPNDGINYDYGRCTTNQWGVFCSTNMDYPAYYRLPNVISVNGHTISEEPVYAYSTNYFDIAAPAHMVQFSDKQFVSGNSVACAIVTGIAALIKEKYPQDDIKRRIISGADRRTQYAKHNINSASVNAFNSLQPYLRVSMQAGDLYNWQTIYTTNILPNQVQQYFRMEITR